MKFAKIGVAARAFLGARTTAAVTSLPLLGTLDTPANREAQQILNEITAKVLPNQAWRAFLINSQTEFRLVGKDGDDAGGEIPLEAYISLSQGFHACFIGAKEDTALHKTTLKIGPGSTSDPTARYPTLSGGMSDTNLAYLRENKDTLISQVNQAFEKNNVPAAPAPKP